MGGVSGVVGSIVFADELTALDDEKSDAVVVLAVRDRR
jgi:hypothetical protein